MAAFMSTSFLLAVHFSTFNSECFRPFVRHYEPVTYDPAALEKAVHRARRAADGDEEPIQLEFPAYQRVFRLSLRRNREALSDDFELISMGTTEPFDASFLYSGELRDRELIAGAAHACPICLSSQKLPEGRDTSVRGNHQHLAELGLDEPGSSCHGSVIRGVFEGFIRTQNGTYYVEPAEQSMGNQMVPTPSLIYHQRDIASVYTCCLGPMGTCMLKIVLEASNYSRLQDLRFPFLMLTMSPTLETLQTEPELEEAGPRQKRSLDYSKTSCLMHFKADYLFYKRFGSLEMVVAQVANYVRAVNAIYESTNFAGIRHIEFKVKTLHVVQEEDATGPTHSPFIGPEKLLMLHARTNWDGYCLAYLLTDRDYSGILGIAFNGQPGDLGGICSRYRMFQGTLRSLNSGLITLQKYGQYLPPRIVHLTLAHELGHSLGAQHDESEECAGYDVDTTRGNYLMFGQATDGEQPNNDRFSPCSTTFIGKILRAKKDQCFVETDRPICGNRIVDPGEECDVGADPTDLCCYPAGESAGRQCQLKPGAQCSPSQGPCCDHACTHHPAGQLCQEETDCTQESTCPGSTAACPDPSPKEDFTPCSLGTQLCLGGRCHGSLCLPHSLEQCDCASSSMREKCHLCCQHPGKPHTCASTTSSVLEAEFNGSRIPLAPGTPCWDRSGYCDRLHVCRLVDEDGPLARVKNAIVGFVELEDAAAWMKTRWWAILLGILTLAALMAGTIFLFGRTLDSEAGPETKSSSAEPAEPDPGPSVTTFWQREIYIHTCVEQETIIELTGGTH
ncbi:disintegrin and metalloproteinase domain-containing protein 10-like [Tachyglossus aculeatus]|uniref:disintegrin and metalloproteinase domain-containing protein 10-like n=1 Tax=Tachyglossus aculeatus TaxID=9261 RepID=UPI0018F34EA0|nr:disintegrin and metalloproteinase domain-containing protein 10-like [Tachyglossus aculeatus]